MQTVVENNPYCSVLNTITGSAKVSKLKGGDRAVVDFVAAVGTGPKELMQKVKYKPGSEYCINA